MYDLAIIGAGWAGFNAAQEAKAQGLKVALIEKSRIGGTCLNRGCIPTKALIQSAKVFEQFKKSKTFGFSCCDPAKPFPVDFSEIQSRKEKIIQQLRQAMQAQLAGIDYFNAQAEIIDKNTLKIADRSIQAKALLIATGGSSIELADFKFNGQNILSSDEILNLKEIPESLLIIGGGVIGCEFASLFSIFNSQVTIVEMMPQLLPGEDKELSRKLETGFKKRGIKINTNTSALAADLKNFTLALVCVGRKPKISGLEALNLKSEKNKIIVDEYLKTSLPGVYAAGDCTGKIMLAHYAAYQGRIAAYNIAHPDQPKKADNRVIPNCIFTFPEIASVGLNEEAAQNQGIEVKINKFDFLGLSMARILDETEGFIKVVSQAQSGQILGAAIIGPKATELIAVFGLAIQSGLKLSQIRDTIFAHPTLSEGISDTLKEDHGV
jgi:dihydrolipoamide dehydrogenase